jgi:glycosyltransferase involved in cell wall biosynthesis
VGISARFDGVTSTEVDRLLRILSTFGGYGTDTYAGAIRMALRTSHQLFRQGCDVALLSDGVPPGITVEGWSPRPPEPGWRPDLVHAYDLASPVSVETAREWARRHRVPFVLTPASTMDVWPDPEAGRACLREADVVFVMNAREEEAVRAVAGSGADIRTIPPAPDLAGSPDPERFRRRYGIAGPMVVFLGRRVPSKGHAILLDAAPQLWRTLPDTTVVFAGPGDGADIRARGDRRLLDLGLLDEQSKHDALVACDVLCLPTGADLFPLVFAEAWACGRPVVCTDYPGVAGVVRDGVDGLVVPRTPEAVAAGLHRILADARLRRRLGAAGSRRVRETMSWEQVAAIVMAGYRSALARRSAGAPS